MAKTTSVYPNVTCPWCSRTVSIKETKRDIEEDGFPLKGRNAECSYCHSWFEITNVICIVEAIRR